MTSHFVHTSLSMAKIISFFIFIVSVFVFVFSDVEFFGATQIGAIGYSFAAIFIFAILDALIFGVSTEGPAPASANQLHEDSTFINQYLYSPTYYHLPGNIGYRDDRN